MFDCHVHTNYSHDGKSTINEYTKEIDKGIVDGIGFTEHVDMFHLSKGYKNFDYNAWINNINLLKSKGYDVHAGAEIGYLKCIEEEIKEALFKMNFEYTIFSIHRDDKLCSFSTSRNIEQFKDSEFFEQKLLYYYSTLESLLHIDSCNVIGHIGIFKRYMEKTFCNLIKFNDLIKDLEDSAAKKLADSDKIIEVNTSGLFSLFSATFPDDFFLKQYHYYGGNSICISSDAHKCCDLARGFEYTVNSLKQIGFKYVTIPWTKCKVKI